MSFMNSILGVEILIKYYKSRVETIVILYAPPYTIPLPLIVAISIACELISDYNDIDRE